VCGNVESDVLDRRGYAEASDVRCMVCEDLDLGNGNDVAVVLLRCGQVFTSLGKLFPW
jgi:hypothetical protein